MKKIIGFALLACASLSHAGDGERDYKPFVVFDTSGEQDAKSSLANDYINANVTLGVKTANKVEYSIKSGISRKDAHSSGTSLSSNIEAKIKKSYDLGLGFYPYIAVRLGQKINSDATSFTHYAFDAGAKIPTGEKWALDIGLRYRDDLNYASKDYRSVRYHAMMLYDLDPSNTLGLRYTQSTASNYEEERKGVRVHWQHNY
jgi:hypothetical protein